jgi:hypothetical protein
MEHFNDNAMIKAAARSLSQRFGNSYSLLVFQGLEAYRRGDSVPDVCKAMYDYCMTKLGVEHHGTG